MAISDLEPFVVIESPQDIRQPLLKEASLGVIRHFFLNDGKEQKKMCLETSYTFR